MDSDKKKHHLNGVKAIFFDAGGTLLYPYPSVGEVYARVAREHGVVAEPARLNEIFKQVWHDKDAIAGAAFQDEKSEKRWWHEIVSAVFKPVAGFKNFDVFFDDLYHRFAGPETWRLFDETTEVLKACKAGGYKIGMISNWDKRLESLCDAFDMTRYFDFMLISAVYGKAKPHPSIFNEAVKLAGVKPEESLHVGDSLEDDIRGARAVGVRAVWINRHDREVAHEHDVPVIRNLKELL